MQKAASGLPDIPAYISLRQQDLPYFNAILSARARDEWSDVDLAVASQLAWTQAEIAKETATLEEEGTIVKNDRGTAVTNPRFRAINEHKQSQLALIKTLALHSTASRDMRTIQAERQALTDAKGVISDLQNSLIAPP
jgi:hypothetical protein